MSFDASTIDGGDLPDIPVATDTIAGTKYQRVKQANPNADQTGAYGVDSDPVRTRNRRRGTADYDSGPVAVANGAPASVTATTIYPEGGTVANNAAVVRKLTLTDDAGNPLGTLNLAPENTIPLPVPKSGSWAGLKAGADGAGVVLHVAGAQ